MSYLDKVYMYCYINTENFHLFLNSLQEFNISIKLPSTKKITLGYMTYNSQHNSFHVDTENNELYLTKERITLLEFKEALYEQTSKKTLLRNSLKHKLNKNS